MALGHLEAVLLHSLWQGLLISLAVFVLLHRIPVGRPNLRYGMAVAGLFGLVLAVLVTWCALVYMEGARVTGTVTGITQAATSATVLPAADTPPAATVTQSRTPSAIVPAQVLLWCWFAGVMVMLLRLCWLLRGARSLSRRALPVDDPVVCALRDEMRAALRVSRRVTVRAVEGLASPVAMGLFWPVVLLPLAMITGLTPDQLRVVLAHELAHIRRYDYLVNFLQLVVEALLYFNPAVWWLSRQIRIEREACCDALAANLSGGPEPYAVALAQVARACLWGTVLPAPAQAFGAEQRPGSLADRVRRLLLPGYWPRLRLRGHSILLGLLLSAALLLGLYQSSKLGVAFAGWCFTDAQRVEALNGIDKELIPRPWDPSGQREQVKVSGRLVLPEGKTLPAEGVKVGSTCINRNCTTCSGVRREGSDFYSELPTGEIYLLACVPGYAPKGVGPLHRDAAQPIENIEIVLEPCIPATIRFVDENHAPVAGVAVSGGYQFPSSVSTVSITRSSDADGRVQIDQSDKAPVPVSLTAEAPGFVRASRNDLPLAIGTTIEWVLQTDKPIEGVVVDKAADTPVEGAEVVLLSSGVANLVVMGGDDKVVATSNDRGKFVLQGFEKNQEHYLLVRRAGYGPETVHISQSTESTVKVSLEPRRVRGVIRGDLSLLYRKKPDELPGWTKSLPPAAKILLRHGMDRLNDTLNTGTPMVSSGTLVQVGGMYQTVARMDTPVAVKDGLGTFELDVLPTGLLQIAAGPMVRQVELRGTSQDVTIDLIKPEESPRRLVKLHFSVPDGAPAAAGTVTVSSNGKDNIAAQTAKVPIADSWGELTVPVPGSVTVQVDNLAGYLPKPEGPFSSYGSTGNRSEIPAGAEPFVVETPLERAGAVRGVVLHADGTPAASVRVSACVVMSEWGKGTTYNSLSNMANQTTAKGEFACMPAPLNQTIEVTATMDCAAQRTSVKLSAWKPVGNVELKFGKSIDVPVLVLGPDGLPAPNVQVHLTGPVGTSLPTDLGGRCVFHGVDPEQKYVFRIEPALLYQRETAPLTPDGTENVLRLREGLRLAGETRFSDTDKPAANIRLRACLVPETAQAGTDFYFTDTTTDDQGRFLFTTLSPGKFRLVIGFDQSTDTLECGSDEERTFTAGQAAPALIRVKPVERQGG
jgi:beta-lactamase regulating signal transducer with metallopeptidase domain